MIGIGKSLFKSNVKAVSGAALDPSAQAFITAAGITDATQQSAVNQLVLDLKSANVWTKMKAIYPMVGGTATSMKWNLKDARDLDAAYRLVFSGGGTFSANGYQPNGTNAFANTFFNPTGILALNSAHTSYYSRTNIAESKYDMGVVDNVGGANVNIYNILITRYTGNMAYFAINVNESTVASTSISNSNSLGLFIANRTASNILNGFRNSSKIFNSSVSSIAIPNKIIYIGAVNSFGAQFYSTKECAFASIGDGLTDAESLAFYNAVQTFNTTLNRNV
jgi:hypothetical protein